MRVANIFVTCRDTLQVRDFFAKILKTKETVSKSFRKLQKIIKKMPKVAKISRNLSLPNSFKIGQKLRKIFEICQKLIKNYRRNDQKILETHKIVIQKEYELLRTCAKYFIKIERNVLKDETIYRVMQLPHLPCWIQKINSMVSIIIQGVRGLLDGMRMNNARLCLSSEVHLLNLFSTTSIETRLKLLLKDCFPSLRRLCFNRRNQLEMVDLLEEKVTVDLTKSEIESQEPCELIRSIEQAFASKLTDVSWRRLS